MQKVFVRGSGRLFRSPLLEALSRTSPVITLLAYVPLIIIFTTVAINRQDAPLPQQALLFLSGILSWTLIEYVLHRFVFHFMHHSKVVQRFHYIVHGIHHEYPKDQERLFMPPVPGYLIAGILFGLSYLLMGPLSWAFFPGMISGYLAYVFTHYAIHRYKKPRHVFGFIWDHHNRHHFSYPDKAYGVSTPVWDIVFGTMPPKKE